MSQMLWTNAGGYLASAILSDKLRHALQPLVRFRQFCDIKESIGYNRGDKFNWNIYSDVQQQGGELDESKKMPETNLNLDQGTMIITEFGNSVPYSGKLDNLSEHPITEIVHKVLKNDARKALDSAAHKQFDKTPLRAVGGAGGSITLAEDGTPTGNNDTAMTAAHVKTIADVMAERNIVPFDGENYVAVGRPTNFRPLKDDLEQIHQYTDEGWRMVMAGEIGRYEGIRLIQQTNVASEGWTTGKSDACYFFGADTVAEGMAIPEEIRGKIPDDYGRGKGVAWYGLMGYGLNHFTPKEARIIKWDSAA